MLPRHYLEEGRSKSAIARKLGIVVASTGTDRDRPGGAHLPTRRGRPDRDEPGGLSKFVEQGTEPYGKTIEKLPFWAATHLP